MKPYIKPLTRPAKTNAGEEIEVKVTNARSDYYREVIQEPFWNAPLNRWEDKGRVFHWTELTFLD